MTEPKILLMCLGGMSTSMLVTRMEQYAHAENLTLSIKAVRASNPLESVKDFAPDVLLIGPQIRYMAPQIKAQTTVPVGVINTLDYGRMNGAGVVQQALKLLTAH